MFVLVLIVTCDPVPAVPVGWMTMLPVLPFHVLLTTAPFKAPVPAVLSPVHHCASGQAALADAVSEFGEQPQTYSAVPLAG